MGLLNDIGKKITGTGRDTVKKAKSFADTARLNNQIAEEQRVLAAFYAQIGEKYYTLHKNSPEEDFIQLCDRITAGLVRIAELQTEILKLKNSRICQKCGSACPVNVQFCSVCGAKLPPIEPEEQQTPPAQESEEPQVPPAQESDEPQAPPGRGAE